MKGFSGFIAIVLFSFGVMAYDGHHFSDRFEPLNGELPWPFGSEIPFPWEDINGIWVGEEIDGDAVTYFSLRVRGQTRDERTLEVLELHQDTDAHQFQLLARGQGIESYRVVRGQMVSTENGGGYRFSIRAYDVDRYGERRERAKGSGMEITRVLTVAPIDPRDPRSLSFVLRRVSDCTFDPVTGETKH